MNSVHKANVEEWSTNVAIRKLIAVVVGRLNHFKAQFPQTGWKLLFAKLLIIGWSSPMMKNILNSSLQLSWT